MNLKGCRAGGSYSPQACKESNRWRGRGSKSTVRVLAAYVGVGRYETQRPCMGLPVPAQKRVNYTN